MGKVENSEFLENIFENIFFKTSLEKRMKTKIPDHHHHTILKTKFQKMTNQNLMLKTRESLKLLEHFQNTNG